MRHIPSALHVASRYTKRPQIDDQLVEAALVGLVRAVDAFDKQPGDDFNQYAKDVIDAELRAFMDDCVHARADRVRLREAAAAAAVVRITDALLRQPDVRELALMTGVDPEELASGFLSIVIRHPELLAAAT